MYYRLVVCITVTLTICKPLTDTSNLLCNIRICIALGYVLMVAVSNWRSEWSVFTLL